MKDERPTRAQFMAMPISERKKHITPVDVDGKPYPKMTTAEFALAVRVIGLDHKQLAKKLRLRTKNRFKSHVPIGVWIKGDVKKHKRHALVPGPIAKKMFELMPQIDSEADAKTQTV